MQTQKLRPVFKLVSYNKEFIRSVTSRAAKTSTETESFKSWKEIPGPSSLPIIGILHHFLPGGGLNLSSLDAVQKMYDLYGPIVRIDSTLGQEPMILLSDPESCEQVLRGENWAPIRPGFVSLEHYRRKYKKQDVTKVTGLVTDHGEVWKEFRSTVNPVMLQPKTIKLYATVIDEVAQDMIKRMKSIRDEKNMIPKNFDTEMNLWALESIATVALGLRLNCLSTNLPEDSPEKQLIQCIHDLFKVADELDFKPGLWKFVATPQFKKAMKLYKKQEELTKYFIAKGIEQLKKNDSTDKEKGVLAKLIDINEDIALIMASDMLFAGVDTAANTMASTLYLLAANQEKQNKLREEVLSKSDKSPYLKACIKESMRLMPIISGNLRRTTKEYNLLGYRIPKDMMVVFSHREMSLMDSQYPNAAEYIPERWITEKDDPFYYKNAHPFANAPFGFGARSCIGRRIAELEIETFLSRVIENFQVDWTGPPPKLVQSSLIYVKAPFNYIFNDV